MAQVLPFVDLIIGTSGIVYFIAVLVLLLPGLAVSVRRMHDVDKSGWNILWSLIPFGGLYVLYLAVQRGTAGPNEYGS